MHPPDREALHNLFRWFTQTQLETEALQLRQPTLRVVNVRLSDL
jgi:hypothetical protein